MKPAILRVLALAATVAVVLSCDSGPPTAIHQNQNGGGGGGGGADSTPPSISIDTPTTGALFNIGDSILVTLRLHDDQQLNTMSVVGFKERGSISLGTF